MYIWIIVLLLSFNDGHLEWARTELIFTSKSECQKHVMSADYQDELKNTYAGGGVAYVYPGCQREHLESGI